MIDPIEFDQYIHGTLSKPKVSKLIEDIKRNKTSAEDDDLTREAFSKFIDVFKALDVIKRIYASKDGDKQGDKYREQILKFESIPSSSVFDTHRNEVLTLLTDEINRSGIAQGAKDELNHILESKKKLHPVSTPVGSPGLRGRMGFPGLAAHFPQASSDSDGDISS